MAAERISEAAARGFGGAAERRRARARKAGLASGVKRRQLCDPQARRVKQRELALNFRVRIVDRAEFGLLDAARRARAGIGPSERGTLTSWRLYQARVRSYKAKGQGFCTTNGQSARALEQAGRGRCTRTVQRQDQILAEMGLLRRYHDRRGGSRAGNRDRIRVQFAPSFVTLPSAATTLSPTGRESCSAAPKRGGFQGRSAHAAAERPPGPASGAAASASEAATSDRDEPLTGRWAELAIDWGLEPEVYAASGGSS